MTVEQIGAGETVIRGEHAGAPRQGVPVPDSEWEKWDTLLASCKTLKEGWNGYTAPVPADRALESAGHFLAAMRVSRVVPTRVGPSAMGGIAVTRKVGDRKVLIELYNDGRVFALFSDRRSDELPVEELTDAPASFPAFIAKMREYLDG